ncbi:MAG: hypothetical protein U0133_14300 [Gemmatimonadales bacterium]
MLLLAALLLTDTLRVTPVTHPPRFDGRADSAEYGAPSAVIARPQGTVLLWARHDSAFVYLAARLPDSTFYWGDDLVISLDINGDASAAPDHDDFQWYFRRSLDSSVVFRGSAAGQWQAPRGDPDWRLGRDREGGGWEVRPSDDGTGWSLELRLDIAFVREARGGARPALAFRTYDNDPHGWHTWPAPAGIRQPTELERRPALWAVVLVE